MTKSVLQKILIRLVLLATGLVLSSQVWGQGLDIIYANQTEGIRLRQMNGSQSKDSLSVKTISNTIIWNSWGIGQTSEKFLNKLFEGAFRFTEIFLNPISGVCDLITEAPKASPSN